MIFEAEEFVFEPPKEIAFARRVLIKPSASFAEPHPLTTSRETLAKVVQGIKKISPADIILLEKGAGPDSIHTIYRSLGFDFEHTILLDVNQCIPVAIENPLPKPFALSTFWLPNVILSCDYLISIAPFKVVGGKGDFSIKNLMGLIPSEKFQYDMGDLTDVEAEFGIDSTVADLYFTLPFDLGIVDGRKKYIGDGDPEKGYIEDYGKIFIGTPYEADLEASRAADVETEYLNLIGKANAELGV